MVGAEGFEPSAFWSRTKRATRLRYAPTMLSNLLSRKRGKVYSFLRQKSMGVLQIPALRKTPEYISRQAREVREVSFLGLLCELSVLCVRQTSRFCNRLNRYTAISILSSLPEIGTLSDGKLNRLVGIAPEEKQGGTKEWQRRMKFTVADLLSDVWKVAAVDLGGVVLV